MTTLSSTTGSAKVEIREGELSVELLNIGSLTGKRGKWIHLFEAARFVVFVVDLNQCNDAEKMAETMRFLDTVVNSQWFAAASIILLLNVNIADNSPRPNSGNGNDKFHKVAEDVLKRLQELNLSRLFVSPCNITLNGEAALQFILSTVKEAIVTEALEKGNMLL